MILSVSRRTDIPAFYGGWLFRRIAAKELLVRNPFSFYQVRRLDLRPEAVTAMVFWSKNYAPFLFRIPALAEYIFYCQYTLNAYPAEVEGGLPPLADRVRALRELVALTDSERVIWRYDPILLSPRYSENWHCARFAELAAALRGLVRVCMISFLTPYAKIRRFLAEQQVQEPTVLQAQNLAARLSEIARRYGIEVRSCAEKQDLTAVGIARGSCVDEVLLSRLLGRRLYLGKDDGQRKNCGCAPSVDVGAYQTCAYACGYCYANGRTGSPVSVHKSSPFLGSELQEEDQIKDFSLLRQGCLFEEETRD